MNFSSFCQYLTFTGIDYGWEKSVILFLGMPRGDLDLPKGDLDFPKGDLEMRDLDFELVGWALLEELLLNFFNIGSCWDWREES